MEKLKGIYILNPDSFETIYGQQERREIQKLLDIEDRVFSREAISNHIEIIRSIEVIVSGWGGPCLDRIFLEAAPCLRAFFYGAGTVKPYVTEATWERGIVVTSAASANAVPVAEFAHAQIMLSLKRVWQRVCFIRDHCKWPIDSENNRSVPGAYGSTVGLISLGLIGKMVREKLRDSAIKVIAFDPYISKTMSNQLDVELVSLEELFQRSDVISVHAPLLDETKGMIKKHHLLKMKHGATFLNTARGHLVNEPELIEALQERPDLFAVIDVTTNEPPAKDSPLYLLPNVVMTPHIAGSVEKECRRMGRLVVDEITRFINGKPLRWQLFAQTERLSA